MIYTEETLIHGVYIPASPICDCCQRHVERVRHSMWHGKHQLCIECFIAWYDPDDDSYDPCSSIELGNHIRKKHGLSPLGEPYDNDDSKP